MYVLSLSSSINSNRHLFSTFIYDHKLIYLHTTEVQSRSKEFDRKSSHLCRKKHMRISRFKMMLSNHDVICALVNIALLKQKMLDNDSIYCWLSVSTSMSHLMKKHVRSASFQMMSDKIANRFHVVLEVNNKLHSNITTFVCITTSLVSLILRTIKRIVYEKYNTHQQSLFKQTNSHSNITTLIVDVQYMRIKALHHVSIIFSQTNNFSF